jgi:acyl carrier protein
VKLRGYRIELGEIETVLSRHPAVRQAVAVAREEAAGDKRLVAYVVANGAEAPEPNDLRAHLKQSLPDYMVPSAFVMLDALPLTPSGKVDRQALPAPEGRPAGEAEYVAPRTPTEEVLAAIWAEVLKVDRVGVHDNFFALGGHSLMAMRMVARVRELLGIELPLRTVFETPMLAELALTSVFANISTERSELIGRIREEIDALSAADIQTMLNALRVERPSPSA